MKLPMQPSTWRLALGLCVLLWAVYLLIYSGVPLVIDEQHILAVAESIAQRGAVDANAVRFAPDILPASGSFGPDGNYYTVYGPATSYLAAPLVRLAWAWPRLGAAQAALLLNPLLTAWTGVLVFLYVQRLYGSPRAGLATALLYGLCTLALPSTKWLYTEPLSAFALFGTATALLRYRDRGELRALALAGGLAGLAMAAKTLNGIALPAFLLYAVWAFTRNGRPTPRRIVDAGLACGLPLAAFLAGLGWFNFVRFGNPLSTGYAAYGMQFTTLLWEGLYGLLFSPGKSFFLYSPILLVWPFALPVFLRRQPAEALLGLAVSGILIVTYALYFAWHGGAGWGPRYLAPLVPFFVVGATPALRWLWRRWPARLALLVIVSAGVQFLGAAVKFTHYYSLLEPQFPHADMNAALLFDPRYSPLLGHAALALNPHNYDFAWLRGVDGALVVDWTPVALAAALAGVALLVIKIALRTQTGDEWARLRAVFGLDCQIQARPAGFSNPAIEIAPGGPLAGRPPTRTGQPTRTETTSTKVDLAARAGARRNVLQARPRSRALFGLALVGAIFAPMVSLARYYDDPRYGGDAARWALLHRLETTARPDDAVLSHDAPGVNFYLNYSRVPVPWYGLPRESLPLSPATAALLERLTCQQDRLWLILPHTPPGDPGSGVERWLAERACPATSASFGPDLRLASFVIPGPATWRESGVTLGDAVRLEAYALPAAPPTPGDVFCLALRWRCLAPLPADYTVFVQLLGPDGLPACQSDRPPAAGFRPTSGWQPGDGVEDHHGVPLPAHLPPGDYRLIAGLYRPDTGARLAAAHGDFLDLGAIRVVTP